MTHLKHSVSFFWLSAILVFVLFFSGNGCGGGSAKKSSPAPQPAASETPAPAAGGGVGTSGGSEDDADDADDGEENVKPEKKKNAAKEAEKKSAKKTKKKTKKAGEEEAGEEDVDAAAAKTAKALPKDVARWTREDFLAAKAMKRTDAKYDLTPALAALGTRNHGRSAAGEDAEILTELMRMELPPDYDAEIAAAALAAAEAEKIQKAQKSQKNKGKKAKKKPAAEDADAEEDAPQDAENADDQENAPADEEKEEVKPENMPPLEVLLVVLTPNEVKAGAGALLENGSPAAWKGVMDILQRKTQTDQDRDAVQTMLEKISETRTPENEKLLFRILTDAESIRQPWPEEEKAAMNLRLMGGKEKKNVEGRRVTVMAVGGSRNLTDITAREMRDSVMNLGRERFSPAFRKEIALFLMNPKVDKTLLAQRDYQQFLENMLRYVMEKKPANLDAQLALYLLPSLPAQQKDKLEENLLPLMQDVLRAEFLLADAKTITAVKQARSAAAETPDEDEKAGAGGWSLMGGAGRTGETPQRNTSGGAKNAAGEPNFLVQLILDDDLREDYARRLWANEVLKVEMGRLSDEVKKILKNAGSEGLTAADFRSGQNAARALEMLVVSPRAESRKVFFRILTLGWGFGPAVMQQLGILGKAEPEPGFLMVLKSLERKDPPKVKSGGSTARTDKKPAASVVKREAQQKTAGDWMKACEAQVKTWCDQFALAGQLQMELSGESPETVTAGRADAGSAADADTDAEDGGEKSSTGGTLSDFPASLPAGAEIQAVYRKTWQPEDAAARGESLKIHFVRFTCEARWVQIQNFFRKTQKGMVLRETETSEKVKPTALWLERYRVDDGAKKCLSVDVHITLADGEAIDLKAAGPVKMQVDVLVMEMDDLKGE